MKTFYKMQFICCENNFYIVLYKKGDMQLNNRVKERRKELGITQSELAQMIGDVSRQYISRIESNKGEIPSLVFANKLSKMLDVCVYRLFDLDGNGEYNCLCCK